MALRKFGFYKHGLVMGGEINTPGPDDGKRAVIVEFDSTSGGESLGPIAMTLDDAKEFHSLLAVAIKSECAKQEAL